MVPSAAAAMYDSATRILSIDVDDLLVGTADYYGEPVPAGHRSTIEHDVRTTLDVLARCDARATFFVNTQYCTQFPAMLKEIHDHGHVLASHGDRHRNVAELSLAEFERDLCRSLELLARVQPRVLGYRPPAFSMPYDDAHLDILRTHGVRYVPSGVGVARSNAPRWMRPAPLPGGVTHVPISTAYLLGGRVKSIRSATAPSRVSLPSGSTSPPCGAGSRGTATSTTTVTRSSSAASRAGRGSGTGAWRPCCPRGCACCGAGSVRDSWRRSFAALRSVPSRRRSSANEAPAHRRDRRARHGAALHPDGRRPRGARHHAPCAAAITARVGAHVDRVGPRARAGADRRPRRRGCRAPPRGEKVRRACAARGLRVRERGRHDPSAGRDRGAAPSARATRRALQHDVRLRRRLTRPSVRERAARAAHAL